MIRNDFTGSNAGRPVSLLLWTTAPFFLLAVLWLVSGSAKLTIVALGTTGFTTTAILALITLLVWKVRGPTESVQILTKSGALFGIPLLVSIVVCSALLWFVEPVTFKGTEHR